MKNPNVCRKIMYALIFSGLIIANGSAVLFGTDAMSPGFIMGGICSGYRNRFRIPDCPLPSLWKAVESEGLGHRILFTLRRIRSA